MGLKVIRNLVVMILSLMALGFIAFVGQDEGGIKSIAPDPLLAELRSLPSPVDPLMGEVSASLVAQLKQKEKAELNSSQDGKAGISTPISTNESPSTVLPSEDKLLKKPKPEKDKRISLNFHRTSIRSILQSLSPILNRVFLLPSELEQNLTLVSPSLLPADEAYRTLVSVLTLSGFEVREEGRVVRLIPLKEVRTLALSRLSAVEAGNFLEHFGRSKSSRYFLDTANQRLIVQGSRAELDQIEQLLHQVDQTSKTKNRALAKSNQSH
jgi:type II secretory pathway component GspD/PulD (secretin)